MQSVSLIIVNWNTGKLLNECLVSLEKLPEREAIRTVAIVDNASTDTSIQQAQETADRAGFTILLQDTNLGFARANNIGIRYAQEHGGAEDHILLLNPDTHVKPGAIAAMLEALEKHPTVGIVGPKLLERNGQLQPSVRSLPTLTVLFLQFLKLHLLLKNTDLWKRYMVIGFNYEKEQLVDQVMGAAFLIRNSGMKQLNGLDEAYWIWFEEVDFCKRAKDAGYQVMYTPTGSIMHVQGTSFHQLVGLSKTKPFLDSSLVYVHKHFGTLPWLMFCILYPIGIGIALLASVAHMIQKGKNKKRL